MLARLVVDSDGLDHDRLQGAVIAVRLGVIDGHNDVLSGSYLAEYGVLRGRGLVEEVEKGVVHGVDEKLGSTRIRGARVGH